MEVDSLSFEMENKSFTRSGNFSPSDLDIDTSRYPFPNTLWHVKPTWEMAIKTSVMLAVGLPGLYMNGVILFVVIMNKWLWSPTNFLIGNLALIDFLTLLLCPWFMLVRDFHQNFVLQNFGCRFEGFMQASLLLANVAAVILVCYDRLAAAVLPGEARVTKTAAPRLIYVSWILSVLFATPWIICREYIERQWLDYLETYCREDPHVLNIYWHFIIILLVWLPMVIMLITYGTIMWKLERSARELSSRGGGQLVARAKSRTLRVTACVLLTNFICRLPYSVMIYMRDREGIVINWADNQATLWFMSNFLMYLNCAINPLIYGFTNGRLLKAMDRTPGVSCCKFGVWCCSCASTTKKEIQLQEKNTEKIFVIEATPKPNKKLSRVIMTLLHIQTDVLDLSVPKFEESTKPTKVTPLKAERIVDKADIKDNNNEVEIRML